MITHLMARDRLSELVVPADQQGTRQAQPGDVMAYLNNDDHSFGVTNVTITPVYSTAGQVQLTIAASATTTEQEVRNALR